MKDCWKAAQWFPVLMILVATLGFAPVSALARDGGEVGPSNGFGARTGVGIDPDQWVIGAQSILGKSLGIFRFAPSFDLGFGNSLTTYALNLDFVANGDLPGSRSQVYAGAGGALVGWSHTGGGNSDLEIGLNVLGGVRLPTKGTTQYNLEARFGFSDAPDFRILVGILFGSGAPDSAL